MPHSPRCSSIIREGDDYEIELPARVAQGVVQLRRVITFEVGELTASRDLISISCVSQRRWQKSRRGPWRTFPGGEGQAVNINQFGMALANRRFPDVSALLDKEQYEILSMEDRGALSHSRRRRVRQDDHRPPPAGFAFLSQASLLCADLDDGRRPRTRLVRLTERLLSGLGMDGSASHIRSWVKCQGRRILKGLPKRVYGDTPPPAIFIKRHGAMLAAWTIISRYLHGRIREGLHSFSARTKRAVSKRSSPRCGNGSGAPRNAAGSTGSSRLGRRLRVSPHDLGDVFRKGETSP